MTRYLESAAARNQEDSVARVLESGGSGGGGGTITETWTGSDGTAWPHPPWTVTRPTDQDPGVVTNTIQGNRGRLTAGGAPYILALAQLAGSTHTDVDIRLTYAVGGVFESYVEVYYRAGALGGAGYPASCYTVDIEPAANQVNLQYVDSGGGAFTIATVDSAGVNVTTDLKVRILVVGNNHKVKWWTGTEPGTWQIDTNDATFTTGTFALALYSGAGSSTRQVEFDDLSVEPLTPAPPAVVFWKGVGVVREAGGVVEDMDSLNCSWYYDWGSYSSPPQPWLPGGAQYVPMVWGDWELYGEPGPSAAVGSSKILLGFNEPDEPSQSNMTVARALALWPQLEATGALLGSPAPSSSGNGITWLSSFMSGNGGTPPRVDIICAHWYVEYNMGYSDLGDWLDYLHTTYPGKPIWLTEVGSLGSTSASFDTNAALMPTVMGKLATRPWVERIAWFVCRRYPGSEAGWPYSRLVEDNGTLNAAGTQWATYDAGPMAGISIGTSTTTGTLSVTKPLVATTVPGTSTTTGALAVARPLAGTAGGLSTTTGALAVARALVGTATGVSTDSGVMIVARALAGTATGQSTTTGDLAGSSAKTLNGQADGSSTTTGALVVQRGLVGTSDGLSTAGATTMVAQRALVGSTGGLSTTTGALARAVPLAGSVAGLSTASATTLSTAGLPGGQSDGASTVTGTLSVARALVGNSAGASTTTGAVARAVPVAGSATGLSTTTGALTVERTLVGSASGVSTAGGTALTVARALAGSTGGLSTTTASLLATAAGGLSGFTAGSSTTTGALSVARPLAGTSGGVGATTGALVKAVPLASTSAVGVGSTTGVIARGVALTATASGTSDAAGNTRVARSLVGTSDGLSTANAALTVARRLAGSSSGTSGATGTLQTIRIEAIYGLWDGQPFQAMQYGDKQVVDFLIIPS